MISLKSSLIFTFLKLLMVCPLGYWIHNILSFSLLMHILYLPNELYLFTNVRCSYSLIIYKQKNQIPFCAKIFEYIFFVKKTSRFYNTTFM